MIKPEKIGYVLQSGGIDIVDEVVVVVVD